MSDSNITDILPEPAKYADKAQWCWSTSQAPGAGKNIYWQPDVGYLESVSDERELRRCTARVLRYLGAQYIVGTFRWLSEMCSSSSDRL